MNRKMTLPVVLAATIAAFALTACEKKGPMEKAGEAIDSSVEKAKDAVTPDGPLERAGESADKAIDKAKEEVNQVKEDMK